MSIINNNMITIVTISHCFILSNKLSVYFLDGGWLLQICLKIEQVSLLTCFTIRKLQKLMCL